jgi:hypothetical protein
MRSTSKRETGEDIITDEMTTSIAMMTRKTPWAIIVITTNIANTLVMAKVTIVIMKDVGVIILKKMRTTIEDVVETDADVVIIEVVTTIDVLWIAALTKLNTSVGNILRIKIEVDITEIVMIARDETRDAGDTAPSVTAVVTNMTEILK